MAEKRRAVWPNGGVRTWTVALLVAVAVAGCARIKTQEVSLRLRDATRLYVKALRWNEFDAAGQFIFKREGEPRADDPRLLEAIRVTASDVLGRRLLPGGVEADVTLRLSYYHVDTRAVVTITESGRWWYDPESRAWYLDGDLPDFAAGLRRKRR